MSLSIQNLSQPEKELLLKAPALIAMLVGGADDNLDRREREVSEKLIRYKKISGHQDLIPYFEEVHQNFENHLNHIQANYPGKAAERNPVIAAELEKLNPILARLDREVATTLVKNLKKYAKDIAGASGGLLGFLSHNDAESHWMNLSMIEEPA